MQFDHKVGKIKMGIGAVNEVLQFPGAHWENYKLLGIKNLREQKLLAQALKNLKGYLDEALQYVDKIKGPGSAEQSEV